MVSRTLLVCYKDKSPGFRKIAPPGYRLHDCTMAANSCRLNKEGNRLVKAGHEIFFSFIPGCSNAAAAVSMVPFEGMACLYF
jgi:hypothetical protein